ncbi:MAG: GAF domain-containing protein [Halanaerobiales bacterium]|nr:GAF domain-containing protein [Halanaerobiales bacterium]
MENKENGLLLLNQQLVALLGAERDWLVNLANSAALLFNQLPDVNWAGFYLYREKELVLGPFQGQPACTRIPIGKGVCGSAARDRITYLVPDVDQFPGHIACDQASRSELVIPMLLRDQLLGVMDIDSPLRGRFDQIDRKYLEEFTEIVLASTDFTYV